MSIYKLILCIALSCLLLSSKINANTNDFWFELPIDGSLKEDVYLEALSRTNISLPWTSAFDYKSKVGEWSILYFPVEEWGTDTWPTIHLTNNIY